MDNMRYGCLQKPGTRQPTEAPQAKQRGEPTPAAPFESSPATWWMIKKIITISLLGRVGNLFIVTVEHTDTVENFDSFAMNFPALHQ